VSKIIFTGWPLISKGISHATIFDDHVQFGRLLQLALGGGRPSPSQAEERRNRKRRAKDAKPSLHRTSPNTNFRLQAARTMVKTCSRWPAPTPQ
jgi:hypothetical protein